MHSAKQVPNSQDQSELCQNMVVMEMHCQQLVHEACLAGHGTEPQV